MKRSTHTRTDSTATGKGAGGEVACSKETFATEGELRRRPPAASVSERLHSSQATRGVRCLQKDNHLMLRI